MCHNKVCSHFISNSIHQFSLTTIQLIDITLLHCPRWPVHLGINNTLCSISLHCKAGFLVHLQTLLLKQHWGWFRTWEMNWRKESHCQWQEGENYSEGQNKEEEKVNEIRITGDFSRWSSWKSFTVGPQRGGKDQDLMSEEQQLCLAQCGWAHLKAGHCEPSSIIWQFSDRNDEWTVRYVFIIKPDWQLIITCRKTTTNTMLVYGVQHNTSVSKVTGIQFQ